MDIKATAQVAHHALVEKTRSNASEAATARKDASDSHIERKEAESADRTREDRVRQEAQARQRAQDHTDDRRVDIEV